MAARRHHPHFDDRGTLDWNVRWTDALSAAKAGKKLVFVEMGRELCSSCRALVTSVIPRPDVAPLLQEHYVALASDADETEDEVIDLAQNLEDAMMLPFVLIADADGRFLGGSSGSVNPITFATMLKRIAEQSANKTS